MGTHIRYADIEVGTKIPEQEFTIRRVDLLRYCSACSDFTATHWNERIAKSVGLPDVISHGTFNIASAVRIVTEWLGDPGALVEYSVRRFTWPIVVPDDDHGARLLVSGVVEDKLPGNRVVVRLQARSGEHEVMAGARAVAQLS
jgi:acyl dehydratase